MPARQSRPALTDIQAAIVDYVTDPRSGGHGRPLAEVAAELSTPTQPITEAQITAWIAAAGRPTREPDPLGGEVDESKRQTAIEERYRDAAETIPGAADILGVERFRAEAVEIMGENASPELAEVVAKMLDFLVPEVAIERWERVCRHIPIPMGGTWQVWEGERQPGVGVIVRSTLAMYDAGGHLVAIHRWTRPKSRPRHNGASMRLPCWVVRPVVQADLRAVAQRIVQVALEFRPGRHEKMTQKELAMLCDRTKQAISHQRGVVAKRVLAATGGRAGFRGRRNLRVRA